MISSPLSRRIAAVAACAVMLAPVPAQAQSPSVMSGVGPFALEAVQMYPWQVPNPLNAEGTAFRDMSTCADRVMGSSGAPWKFAYVAAAGCVALNPFLNARLDAEMRRAHG